MLTTLVVAGTLLSFGGCDWAKPEPETYAACNELLVGTEMGWMESPTWESKEGMQSQIRVLAACTAARRITRSKVTKITADGVTVTCEATK